MCEICEQHVTWCRILVSRSWHIHHVDIVRPSDVAGTHTWFEYAAHPDGKHVQRQRSTNPFAAARSWAVQAYPNPVHYYWPPKAVTSRNTFYDGPGLLAALHVLAALGTVDSMIEWRYFDLEANTYGSALASQCGSNLSAPRPRTSESIPILT